MRQIMKYALPSVLLIVMVLATTLAPVPASAQSSSGQFNPQTQFAVGTKLQITSIYGLELAQASTMEIIYGTARTEVTIKPHEAVP